MSNRTISSVVVIAALIGIVVGAAAAPTAWNAATQPDGRVAVIELHSTITSDTADQVIDNLREARHNASIKAVVLDINSPGGSAAASEQLYLAVNRTAQQMPVVTSVTGMAASGGYYTAVGSDEIFVTPASNVGSVGVRAVVPTQGVPNGEIVTGPDKGATATVPEVRRQVETLRRAFIGTVEHERTSLQLNRTELSYAKLYSGARGVDLGLADSVGGIDRAIQTAGAKAGLSDYEVVRMQSPQVSLISQLGLQASGESISMERASTAATFDFQGVNTVRYLTLYGSLKTNRTEVTAK